MTVMYQRFGKRLLDFLLSTAGGILLSPLMLILAILVRIKFGSPVLFRQQRPGLHGHPFTLYKFRTMTDARDEAGNLLPDEDRLTPFGRFLRSTSLDELPELWNVIKGDMSLVGPRPLLMRYLPRYTPEQMRRHEVRPGITGWAQIHGRQTIPFSKRIELDLWYVDNVSFKLDIMILGKTIHQALLSKGVILGQEIEEVDDLIIGCRSI